MANKDNEVKETEKVSEIEAEDVPTPVEEEIGLADENAIQNEMTEKIVGETEDVPAEISAINTDTATAKEASIEKKENNPPKAEVEGEKMEEDKKELTGKYADLVKQIETLSVLELSELVKVLEERFGVSAAAPVAMVGAAPAAAEAEEEKSSYSIVIANAGDQKIAVIKVVREVRPDLGLKEAKDLVDGAPKELKANVSKDEAEESKKKLEAAGATVELK